MLEDYAKARKMGERQLRKAVSQGQYPYPPALDDIAENVHSLNEVPVGLVEIPLDMIAGTKTRGRQNAFSAGFLPILNEKTEFASKWSHLYDAQMNEGIRDAIKVYEYMQRFYVEEGNKRVSVLKYLNVPMILGDVIRIEPAPADDKRYRIYKEFEKFYMAAPLYQITFSEEGRYGLLAEKVGQSLDAPWPEEVVETVRSAYLYFEKLFLEKGGDKLAITVGDAFLVYLSVYSADSLLQENRTVLNGRLDRLWNEFLVASEDDSIALVETPQEGEKPKSSHILSGIGNILKKTQEYSKERPLRVAFIYEKRPDNSSWTYGHELGRNELEQAFAGVVETLKFEDCASEEAMRRAFEAAAADESDMVVTISPSQMAETLRAAIEYPKIRFLNCSVNLSHSAVRTFYGRMYEAKFLMGALAASVARNHRIGYRADAPIYGTIANINAFAIGAAMVDPKAEIYLTWSSLKDVDWRAQMREKEVRVQSGPDLINPQEAGREYGIYEVDEDDSFFNLAMPVWNWGRYYELIVSSVLNGTFDERNHVPKEQALNYWYGMSSGVIDVIMSEKISYYSRKLVRALKRAVVADVLSPFDGEIRSKTGLIKKAEDPRIPNSGIITMDWLNDNVIGSIPELDEIADSPMKETVKVSGVAVNRPESGSYEGDVAGNEDSSDCR